MIRLNSAVLRYNEEYKERFLKDPHGGGLIDFGSYIAKRILGEKFERNPILSYYFAQLFGSDIENTMTYLKEIEKARN